MTLVNRLLAVGIGLFIISAGIAKFSTGHVFQYIEFRSGIDLFYPFVNNLTGIAEIAAGLAILYRPTRLAGSLVASALMSGAIVMHLSPWLGISIPTGLADGAASPWAAEDFASTTTPASFFLATAVGGLTMVMARREFVVRRMVRVDDHEVTAGSAELVEA